MLRKIYGLAHQSHLARRQVSRHLLERLESCRLAGQRDFFVAVHRAVVCDGKKKAGRGAAGVDVYKRQLRHPDAAGQRPLAADDAEIIRLLGGRNKNRREQK